MSNESQKHVRVVGCRFPVEIWDLGFVAESSRLPLGQWGESCRRNGVGPTECPLTVEFLSGQFIEGVEVGKNPFKFSDALEIKGKLFDDIRTPAHAPVPPISQLRSIVDDGVKGLTGASAGA